MHLDGENPGAGSQVADSNGLNGNMWKLDYLFEEHNTDGTHKDSKIGKAQLKTDVADGSTIEKHATNGLQLKDGGITGAKMNQTAGQVVDGTGLEFNTNAIRLKDGGVLTAKLADDAVTAAKISHDNNRTKNLYSLAFAAKTAGTYAKYNGELTTAALGIPMLRAGKVTKIMCTHAGGGVVSISNAYGSGGLGSFDAGDRINAAIDTWTSDDYVTVNNINDATNYTSGFEATVYVTGWTAPIFVEIEVEFDD